MHLNHPVHVSNIDTDDVLHLLFHIFDGKVPNDLVPLHWVGLAGQRLCKLDKRSEPLYDWIIGFRVAERERCLDRLGVVWMSSVVARARAPAVRVTGDDDVIDLEGSDGVAENCECIEVAFRKLAVMDGNMVNDAEL